MYAEFLPEILALLALATLVWWWLDSLRARERALEHCRYACERNGLQLLDETVACVSLRPERDADGRLVLRRIYAFEFTDNGNNRRHGSIVMLAGHVESVYTEPYLLQ